MSVQVPDVTIAHAPARKGAATAVRGQRGDRTQASVAVAHGISPLHGDSRVSVRGEVGFYRILAAAWCL